MSSDKDTDRYSEGLTHQYSVFFEKDVKWDNYLGKKSLIFHLVYILIEFGIVGYYTFAIFHISDEKLFEWDKNVLLIEKDDIHLMPKWLLIEIAIQILFITRRITLIMLWACANKNNP